MSQGEVKMSNVWEYGVNTMMQRFTVGLDYGDHCFHQPVMKDSHFVAYFKVAPTCEAVKGCACYSRLF